MVILALNIKLNKEVFVIIDDAFLARARKRLIQMHYESGVGHIGGNLSSLDAMLLVFHEYMKPNDDFILSKGHSAGALYISLWTKGKLTDADLQSFHKDETLLGGHPPVKGIPEIPFAVYAVAFTVIFTGMNLRGIESSSRTNTFIATGLGIVIVLLLGAAVRYLLHNRWLLVPHWRDA